MSDINQIFTSWGKAQRQLPERNAALKSETLSRLPKLSGSTAQSRIPWFSLAFAGLAVIALVFKPLSQEPMETISLTNEAQYESEAGLMKPTAAEPLAHDRVSYPYYPPQQTQISISDDRQFLKINYSAEIQTRNPDEQAQRLQVIIRGLGGRIDSLNTTEESGYISFALPEEKLESLRHEVTTLEPDKFIREIVSANNLLPEKRKMEDQKKSDQQLLDNVATVNGTVSLEFISVWEVIELYAGPYWLAILLGLAAIAVYVNRVRISRKE